MDGELGLLLQAAQYPDELVIGSMDADVVQWLAEGKTNPKIAAILSAAMGGHLLAPSGNQGRL